jgi:prepilin-type N-terminal cleavage/methylation domain-containing protein
MQKTKGFTIIELIVVIAIIAVLASIVLVNVTSYINKSRDSSIKANLATILVNATDYFYKNSNYTSFETSSGYTVPAAMLTNSPISSTPTYVGIATAFCVKATLKDGTTVYCVDSTGYKGLLVSGKCVTGTYTCQ